MRVKVAPGFGADRTDFRLLLAAVEAALKLPGEWEKKARRLNGLAGEAKDPPSRIAISLRAQAFEDCAGKVRAAITTALTGKEAGDGQAE